MAGKSGEQPPHSDPGPDAGRGDEEKEKKGPNIWQVASVLLSAWRLLRDVLSDDQPPSSGPSFLRRLLNAVWPRL